MTVTYDSHEAGALDLVIKALADSATWRGLQTPAATTTTEGKGRVVESDGGFEPDEGQEVVNVLGTTIVVGSPLAVVHGDEWQAEERALGVERRTGKVKVRLYLPKTAGDKAPEQHRRARNQAGAIRSEMAARFRTAGYLACGSASLNGPYIEDDTGAWRDVLVCDIDVSYRA